MDNSIVASEALKFDEIGYWSEIKLEIVKKYAQAYSTILATKSRLSYAYIDGFAGTGVHLTRKTPEILTWALGFWKLRGELNRHSVKH